MKVAIINAFYGFGSTGKGVIATQSRFEKLGYNTRVYYGLKRNHDDPKNVFYIGNRLLSSFEYRISNLIGTHGMLSFIQTRKLLKNLNGFQPNIVWLNNIHDDYVNEFMLLNYLKKKNVLTIYSMVDEYAFLGRCCSVTDCLKYKDNSECRKCPHQDYYPSSRLLDLSHLKYKLKAKAYDGFDTLVFRSAPYVIHNAKNSLLLGEKKLFESDSSVDTKNIYYPRETEDLRTELKISKQTKVVLLCAPFSDKIKGGKYFLEAARQCISDNIVFINVAFDGDKKQCPPNFIPLPFEKNRDRMAQLYSLADAYICTSISDAQPNTCLEALGCGTPIIGFNISGVPYTASSEFGTFVEPLDIEALVNEIRAIEKKTPETEKRCHMYAEERFSLEKSELRFQKFLKTIISMYM